MIRVGVIVGAMVIALLCCAVGRAAAADVPTLADAQYQVTLLDQQVVDAQALVDQRELAVESGSGQLERAADRLATLTDQPVHIVPPWEMVSASRKQRRIAAARAALARAQRQVAHSQALPRLVAAEHDLRHVTKLQDRAKALVDTLQQAALAEQPVTVTRGVWAEALLHAIGAPTCSNNMVSLVAWQTAENTTAAFNPLATTLPAAGASTFNSAGVRNYSSLTDGIQATVQTLQSGYATFGYGWILYRLGRCDPPAVTAGAINASDWCRACAGGRYVTGIVPVVAAEYDTYERL